MSQSTDTTWRANLNKALVQNSRQAASRFAQLATCDSLGLPHCRTVVMRGFVENSDALIVHTHHSSEKIKHLHKQPQVELCWYFADTREQFRLKGKVEIVSRQGAYQALREQQWHKLSSVNQQSYSQQSPHQLFVPEMQNLQKDDVVSFSQASSSIPDTFILLLLWPNIVDHLLLAASPQERYLHSLDKSGHWQVRKVSP